MVGAFCIGQRFPAGNGAQFKRRGRSPSPYPYQRHPDDRDRYSRPREEYRRERGTPRMMTNQSIAMRENFNENLEIERP